MENCPSSFITSTSEADTVESVKSVWHSALTERSSLGWLKVLWIKPRIPSDSLSKSDQYAKEPLIFLNDFRIEIFSQLYMLSLWRAQIPRLSFLVTKRSQRWVPFSKFLYNSNDLFFFFCIELHPHMVLNNEEKE